MFFLPRRHHVARWPQRPKTSPQPPDRSGAKHTGSLQNTPDRPKFHTISRPTVLKSDPEGTIDLLHLSQ